jgi:CubicO group peptidase (beta-lactamase class C family)
MPLAATMAQVALSSGYGPDDPLVIGVRRGGRPAYLMRGCLPAAGGTAAAARDSLIYAASLAKQVTAACVALAGLDPDVAVTDHLPELREWARGIRLRHLIHHTAGLPADLPLAAGADRTTAGMLAALWTTAANRHTRRLPSDPPSAGVGEVADTGDPPTSWVGEVAAAAQRSRSFEAGRAFDYSNVGYVLLAEAVARTAGEPLASLARRRIFEPLGMSRTTFWAGPEPTPPGAVRLDPAHPAPLSIGDGGMWSTAADLLRWAAALDADELGITGLLETPGRLDDGTVLEYAWGMGVREHAGRRVLRHGGSYADTRTMLLRVPEEGFDLVVLAPADRSERRTQLTDRLLDALVR